MSDQKRQFKRVDHPCHLTLWLDNGYEILLATSVNVSAGGLLVNLDRSLRVGAKVEVKVDFRKGIHLHCFGSILRCQQNASATQDLKNLYFVAIHFENVDEAKREEIKIVIEELERIQKP